MATQVRRVGAYMNETLTFSFEYDDVSRQVTAILSTNTSGTPTRVLIEDGTGSKSQNFVVPAGAGRLALTNPKRFSIDDALLVYRVSAA